MKAEIHSWCMRCATWMPTSRAWCDECHKIVVAELRAKERLPCGCQSPNSYWLTSTLHVFFISIRETCDMIDRLGCDTDHAIKVARSKVFAKDSRVPNPVDRVAKRVAS